MRFFPVKAGGTWRRGLPTCRRAGVRWCGEDLESRQLLSVSTISVQAVDVAATEGRHFDAEVATFSESNGDLRAGDFRALIDWGDGTASSGQIVSDPSHHQLKVFGQHTYRDEGSEPITVTVSDRMGNSAVDAFFQQSNLVSDGFIPAAHTDPNLVNAWGIVPNPTGVWWVNDNGTGLSTLYDGNGVPQSLVVTIPPPAGSPAGTIAKPTGIVFNATASDFQVTGGKAAFIFATEDGTISAWNPAILNDAQLKFSSPDGAIYKGLAAGSVGANNFLYAADFHNGKIDVFDGAFAPTNVAGNFTDPTCRKATRRLASPTSAASCSSPMPNRTPTPKTTQPARATDSSTSIRPTASCFSISRPVAF